MYPANTLKDKCQFLQQAPLAELHAFSWLMADVIPWINKASLVLYIASCIMHAACHAMSDLKFESCTSTALSSSSPVIEASKLVSRSQTPSL